MTTRTKDDVSTRAEWLATAAACEAATGPDREIDWRMTLALGVVRPAPGTTPDDDRMADCRAAVEPSVAAIVAAATAAGWHPVETLTAIKAMVSDMLRGARQS